MIYTLKVLPNNLKYLLLVERLNQHGSIRVIKPLWLAWVGGILAAISTPASPPKPRGKSPGWQTGQPRSRRIRYPVVKKGTRKLKKQQAKSA